ncbi:MAG: hypothetical protein WBQ94_02785, partial [Terracidiphilus sp.]
MSDKMREALKGPDCGCDEFPECTHALYWYQGFKAALAAQPDSPAPAVTPSAECNWKGVPWDWSVKATNVAEAIALHFAHDCNDSMCGEDADACNCEFAWVEDTLTDFLEAISVWRTPDAIAAERERCAK